MRARVVRFAAAFQSLLLIATLVVPALAAATEISTDLWVYQDGDTVTVTGIDFGANEVVDFVTTDPVGTVVDSGSASSDENGGVVYSFALNATISGIYDVVGTGEASGFSAATQFDPPATVTTTTTLGLSSASITYGSSTTMSGTLAWTAGVYNQGQQSKDGRTIHLNSYTNSNCTSGTALIANATTSGGGASGTASYSFVYTPTSAGTRFVRAVFDGFELGSGSTKDTYSSSVSTPCLQFDVNKANTTTTGSASPSSIFVTQNFLVSYSTSATVGLVGNTAAGAITVVKDSGPGAAGSLGCTPASIALSQGQAAGGFTQSGLSAFTCTPTGGAGTYTMHVQFTDSDGNYNNSSSATLTVVVSGPHSSLLTESVSTPITYGSSAIVSGTLTDTTAVVPIGSVSIAESTWSSTNVSCTGSTSSLGSSLTNGSGNYSLNFTPTSAGTRDIKVSYAGDVSHAPATNCATLVVNKANTSTTGSASTGAIFNSQSFTVGYTTSALVGLVGNTATGTITIAKDGGPGGVGSVGCAPASVVLSQGQAAGGFSQSAATAFTCTPTGGAGIYTFHVHFADTDGNYNNSDGAILTVVVSNPNQTDLTAILTPATIFYGQSTTISGSLDDTTAVMPIVNVSVSTDRQSGNNCAGSSTFIASDFTDASGDYSVTYKPSTTETKDIEASYAGDLAHEAATACATLTVLKAPTTIVNETLSDVLISDLETTFVSYKVQSAYGILGHNANGTLSIVQDTGPGTLTCSAISTALNVAEANAAGLGAADAGFGFDVNAGSNAGYRFECSADAPGTYTFHVNNTGDGDFAASDSDTLTLVVTPSDAIAPIVMVTTDAADTEAGTGWYNIATSGTDGVLVHVSATDGSGVTNITCDDNGTTTVLITSSNPDSFVLGNGNHSIECVATDGLGNTGASSGSSTMPVLYAIDQTAPTISSGVSPVRPASGWWNIASGAPTVTYTCGDAGSGLASCLAGHGELDNTYTFGEGADQTDTGTATDNAGNTNTAGVIDIDVDLTAPTISSGVSPVRPASGWWNIASGAPTVTYTCGDAGSGLASCLAGHGELDNTYTFGEGADQTDTGTATDNAGNTNTAGVIDIDVDLTAPTISSGVSPVRPASGWWNIASGAPTVTYTCGDAGSGLASCLAGHGELDNTYTFGEGADQTDTGTATDNAGNTNTAGVIDIDVDLTAPTISSGVSPVRPASGWWNIASGAPTVTYTCGDAGSGLASCLAGHGELDNTYTFGEGADQTDTGTATDNAGNTNTAGVIDIDVDLTAPTISSGVSPVRPASGWWNIASGAPTVTYTCGDAGSGLASCLAGHGELDNTYTFGEGADQTDTGTATDNAGNTNTAGVIDIDVDLTAPTAPAYVGGPASGGLYYFGFVPAAPTCTSSDALSGLTAAGCVVTGYSNLVGPHTMTATATDKAGNVSTTLRSYTVSAWTLTGFYSPVDMNGFVNTVKGGSTVPLKFEVFAGPTELTSTALIGAEFTVTQVSCNDLSGAPIDEIELTTTGGTSFRYDSTGGQFIQNWQTPKAPGKCYITRVTLDDGSSIAAIFKLK